MARRRNLLKIFVIVIPAMAVAQLQPSPKVVHHLAADLDVPPKDEWRICDHDSDCISSTVDCASTGRHISYNKDFEKVYRTFFNQKCKERIKEGETEMVALSAGPAPSSQCVKHLCEIAPENSSANEDGSYFDKIKKWFDELFK